jgi:hypothetical protein
MNQKLLPSVLSLLCGGIIAFFALATMRPLLQMEPKPEWPEHEDPLHPGSAGLWVAWKEQRVNLQADPAAATEHILFGPAHAFAVDHETVTVEFWGMADPPDKDYYRRLNAKWIGENLYYQDPRSKDWNKVATFKDERFEAMHYGVLYLYRRVPPHQLPNYLLPLLKKRQRHDYSEDIDDW